MKKYRLIKIYPGSPQLGYINDINIIAWSTPDKTLICSDHPEFWEEVIEKDYEILSLNRKTSPSIIENIMEGYTDEFVDKLIKSGMKIYSIKRLSDGEVFTIGDVLKNRPSYTQVIKRFEIIKNSIRLWLGENNSTKENAGLLIKYAKRVLKPLFITNDGVPMFKGNKYYVIANKATSYYTSTANTNSLLCDKKYIFGKKENAENYLLMNKRCLSVNDVISIWKYNESSYCNQNKLINFVKQIK